MRLPQKLNVNTLSDNAVYVSFAMFWIIVLLPKTLQMFPFLILAVFVFLRGAKRPDTFTIFQCLWLGIYALAVVYNLFLRTYPMSRILATVNTFATSVIGLAFYVCFRDKHVDLQWLGQICFYNTLILIVLDILYHFVPFLTIWGKYLGGGDLIYEMPVYRFLALMEYPNLVLFFVLFQFPLALYYVDKKPLLLRVAYTAILLPVLVDTRSRSALVVYSMIACVYLLFLNERVLRAYQNHKKRFILIAVLIAVLSAVLCHKQIFFLLSKLLEAREGSNRTRSLIYQESWNRVMSASPWIGMGIKEMTPPVYFLWVLILPIWVLCIGPAF